LNEGYEWNDDVLRFLISKGARNPDMLQAFEKDIKMLNDVLNKDLINYTLINI
jgi:hypothetical protein